MIISLGDNYQGSFDSHQDKGEKVARLLKELGAGYTLLSDLDLCLGIKQYQKNNTLSGITTLATNLQSQKLKELSKFPQHTFVVKNGFKILFLGGYNQDFFVNQDVQNSSLAAAIKKEIEKIFSSKTQESPNAIILLLKMPDGFDSFSKKIKKKELEEVCQIKGISAIFISDDQHSSYLTRVKGTPIISTSLKDNQISQLDLEFKPKFKFLTLAQAKIVTIKPATFAKSSVYQGTPLATCQTTLENKPTDKSLRTPLGNTICRTLFENRSADFVLLPSSIFQKSLEKGKVTDKDIYNIFGRDHRLFTAKISGKEIKEAFGQIIFTSKDYQFYAPELKFDAKEIFSLKSAGLFGLSPVKEKKLYTVLTTQEGLNQFLQNAEKKRVCNKGLLRSLLDEIENKNISTTE